MYDERIQGTCLLSQPYEGLAIEGNAQSHSLRLLILPFLPLRHVMFERALVPSCTVPLVEELAWVPVLRFPAVTFR